MILPPTQPFVGMNHFPVMTQRATRSFAGAKAEAEVGAKAVTTQWIQMAIAVSRHLLGAIHRIQMAVAMSHHLLGAIHRIQMAVAMSRHLGAIHQIQMEVAMSHHLLAMIHRTRRAVGRSRCHAIGKRLIQTTALTSPSPVTNPTPTHRRVTSTNPATIIQPIQTVAATTSHPSHAIAQTAIQATALMSHFLVKIHKPTQSFVSADVKWEIHRALAMMIHQTLAAKTDMMSPRVGPSPTSAL
jgi:hypothetical protein